MRKDNYINLSPTPASLIESLRDIGYSIETAIADIIDNSITAQASNIYIRFSWNNGDPWLAIIDDGYGMTAEELKNAMRFGSTNPVEKRSADDFGRFGLGMKTASFSQCRHLKVISKKTGKMSGFEWDLDTIIKKGKGEWRLGILSQEYILQHKVIALLYNENLADRKSGTMVIWENFDRVDETIYLKQNEKHFNSLIDDTRQHLELVFHRFISPDITTKKVEILMNCDKLVAFNPFNPRHAATQELPEQKIAIEAEKIVVQPYILPHHNKIPRQEYQMYSGEAGYLHNQGFYVYRNKRLIIKGTWFRLIKKEELNKLIRIRVDIPNSLDHLWKIDVKKSHASPPENIRKELRQVIEKIEVAGRKVYRQRGKKLSSSVKIPVWNRRATGGCVVYEINREHPLIIKTYDGISAEQKKMFDSIISMFESSFPVDLFYTDFANKPEQVEKPKLKNKELEQMLDIFISTWLESGIPKNQITDKLFSAEPFASNKETAKALLIEKGYINV